MVESTDSRFSLANEDKPKLIIDLRLDSSYMFNIRNGHYIISRKVIGVLHSAVFIDLTHELSDCIR